jgi:hypothetical protein
MSVEEAIPERRRALPPEKRKEVLAGRAPNPPLQSMGGRCADLCVSLSEEDPAEARREVWGSFPRDDF